jgi:PAS domain S-box-containing protein
MTASRSNPLTQTWDAGSILASIVDHNPGSIFALDAGGRIVAANQAFSNLTGRRIEELAGAPFESLAADDLRSWSARVVDLARAGAHQHYAITLRRADGRSEVAQVMILPERSGHPQIVAYGFIAGHEYRSRLEQQLRQMLQISQGSLQAMFSSGATGIIIFDVLGRIIDTNPALQQMLGYDALALRSMNIVDLVHPADRLHPRAGQADPFPSLSGPEHDHYQAVRRYVHQNGHLVWAQVTVSAVRGDDGEPQYFICMMQDVTEHKLIQDVAVIANEAHRPLREALHEIISELAEQLGFQAGHIYLVRESIGRVVPTGIWYLEEPGILPNFRELTESTTFAPGSGLIGHVFSSRMATVIRNLPSDTESVRIAAATADGIQTGLYVPMVIHNEIVGVLEFYATEDREVDPNLLDSLTRIAPHLGSLVERERAREAAERQNAELERSNRDLERFASIASHDLQEPLRAIGRCTQLIERRYGDQFDEGAAKLFAFIVDGVHRMEALIQDLLRYSRIGTRSVEYELVDLNDVLDDVLDDLTVALEQSGGVVEVGELPVVRGNRSQLIQLFSNLVGNAVKYRADEPPRVMVKAERSGAVWLLSVQDNGIGVDPAYHEQIFDIFRRLHARDEYGGTGVGLAIAKRIVEQHGGRIWIDSELGRGSTFFVTLPALGEDHHAAAST